MVQNVQYEVPALRKIVQNCVKQQQELHRKEGEYKRSGEEFKARYAKECAKARHRRKAGQAGAAAALRVPACPVPRNGAGLAR